jgi:hypothetical protein
MSYSVKRIAPFPCWPVVVVLLPFVKVSASDVMGRIRSPPIEHVELVDELSIDVVLLDEQLIDVVLEEQDAIDVELEQGGTKVPFETDELVMLEQGGTRVLFETDELVMLEQGGTKVLFETDELVGLLLMIVELAEDAIHEDDTIELVLVQLTVDIVICISLRVSIFCNTYGSKASLLLDDKEELPEHLVQGWLQGKTTNKFWTAS